MGDLLADTMPDVGLAFSQKPLNVINGTGNTLLLGTCAFFGISCVLGNPRKFNSADSAFTIVGVPPVAAAADGYGLVCLLDQDMPPGATGRAWLWHPEAPALVDGAVTYGQPLCLTPTNNGVALRAATASVAKCVAIAMSESGGAGRVLVAFNGLHGWGKGAP